MARKLEVIHALKTENYIEALKIAKTFTIELTKEQNTVVRRAYEMHWNNRFYEALGYNLNEEVDKAVAILKEVYAEHL